MFSGWVNRHQSDVIEYLQEENRVLKERLGGQRIRFTDAERRRLARKAQGVERACNARHAEHTAAMVPRAYCVEMKLPSSVRARQTSRVMMIYVFCSHEFMNFRIADWMLQIAQFDDAFAGLRYRLQEEALGP
jgi:hypothetical protein